VINQRWRSLTPILAAVAVGVVLAGCRSQTAGSAASTRTQWGEPDLMGVWQGPKLGATPGQDPFNLAQLERLYRPEARAKITQLAAKDDPALHCVPQPFPRAAMLGWPIQIVQRPGMMLVLTEAFHTFRFVPTDGGQHHGDYVFPTYVGTAAGRWDGDTLVVEVESFREPWLAGSQDKPTPTSAGVWPTSEALRVVERWRRFDADTIEYQARVEDPMMLTGPWETSAVTLTRQSAAAVEEVKCLVDDPRTPPAAYLAQFGR
jgi:hypothetical protein